jgi:holin-like protein
VLLGFAILLACQFLGDLLVRVTGLPVPGNVLGMVLLLLALMFELIKIEWVTEAADLLLTNMAMLFVPVGVGVMLYFDLLAHEWLPILAATVLSTFVVLAITGHVTQGLLKYRTGGETAGD